MSDPAWALTLGDRTYPLTPSVPALLAIEAVAGRTIFSLIQQVKHDTLPLADLAIVATALAGVTADKDSDLGREFIAMRTGMFYPATSMFVGPIMSAGLMQVTAILVSPLAMALSGKVDAEGQLKKADQAPAGDEVGQ